MARFLSAILLLAILVAAVLVTWPQLLGLEHAIVFAQLVSFRGVLVAVAAGLIVVALVLSIIIRPIRGFLAGLMIILCLFAVANAAILWMRGTNATPLAQEQEGDVTVLAWNTLGDAVSAETIASLSVEQGADVVALPETTNAHALDIAARLADKGSPMTVLTLEDGSGIPARSTSLLVSAALGEYVLDTSAGGTTPLPTVVAVPADGEGPRLVAVHAVAPTAAELDGWDADLAWLASLCGTPNTILAGDFNATLDHLTAFEGCTDAGEEAGIAGLGTWPTELPPLLGTPIDHVMATDGWQVEGTSLITRLDGGGSDHRPIVAMLRPVA